MFLLLRDKGFDWNFERNYQKTQSVPIEAFAVWHAYLAPKKSFVGASKDEHSIG